MISLFISFAVDKLIGKLYPVFGVLLIVMAAAVIGGITAYRLSCISDA